MPRLEREDQEGREGRRRRRAADPGAAEAVVTLRRTLPIPFVRAGNLAVLGCVGPRYLLHCPDEPDLYAGEGEEDEGCRETGEVEDLAQAPDCLAQGRQEIK